MLLSWLKTKLTPQSEKHSTDSSRAFENFPFISQTVKKEPSLTVEGNKVTLKLYSNEEALRELFNQTAKDEVQKENFQLRNKRTSTQEKYPYWTLNLEHQDNLKYNTFTKIYRSRIEYTLHDSDQRIEETSLFKRLLEVKNQSHEAFKVTSDQSNHKSALPLETLLSQKEEEVTNVPPKTPVSCREPKLVIRGQEAILKLYYSSKQARDVAKEEFAKSHIDSQGHSIVTLEVGQPARYAMQGIYRLKLKAQNTENASSADKHSFTETLIEARHSASKGFCR